MSALVCERGVGYSSSGVGHTYPLPPRDIYPMWTDRRLWKHYVSVTNVTGGNDDLPSFCDNDAEELSEESPIMLVQEGVLS